MRRTVAAALAIVAVIVIVRGAGALLGGGSPVTADAVTEPVVPATAVDPDGGGTPATVEPAADPRDDGPPTADDPARVLILGDSDAGGFGPYLDELLSENGVTETDLFYKVSSGLSRPDFFDWPAEIRSRVPTSDPDIVVVTFGGNDAQDLAIDGRAYPVDTDEWREEYGRRVAEVVDLLTADGRTLIWVGIPNAKSPEFTKRLEILRDVTLAELENHPDNVVYIDTWDRFDGLSGGYADFVVDPRDGRGKSVRADDGFHLNITGAEIIALDIAQAVEDELRARGADI